MRLEVVVVPVSDVDRAKEFYQDLGWFADPDRPARYARYMVDEPARQDAS